MVEQLKAVYFLLRRISPVAWRRMRAASSGRPGTWSFEFAIIGLSDERNRELAKTMCEQAGIPDDPNQPSTGKLRMRGSVDNQGLNAALNIVIADFYHRLIKAGLTEQEILDAEMTLLIDGSETPGRRETHPGRRALGTMLYGLNASTLAGRDLVAMLEHGERTYSAALQIAGLYARDLARMQAPLLAPGAKRLPDPIVDQPDQVFKAVVENNRVGSGFHAICLMADRMEKVFAEVPRGAQLSLRVTPGACFDDDQPEGPVSVPDEVLEAVLREQVARYEDDLRDLAAS
jgi:hypothetical protein